KGNHFTVAGREWGFVCRRGGREDPGRTRTTTSLNCGQCRGDEFHGHNGPGRERGRRPSTDSAHSFHPLLHRKFEFSVSNRHGWFPGGIVERAGRSGLHHGTSPRRKIAPRDRE